MNYFIFFTLYLGLGLTNFHAAYSKKKITDSLFRAGLGTIFLILAGCQLYHGINKLINIK